METSLRARGWLAIASLLLLATTAFATPLPADDRKAADESAEMADLTAESKAPPTVNPVDDARPKAASAAAGNTDRTAQRRRSTKATVDEWLGKADAASGPRYAASAPPATSPEKNPASVAVVERMLESVRAPIGAMTAGEEVPVGGSPNVRRRSELPVSADIANESQRAVGSGDDAVVKAVKAAREVLHEPLAWLLLLLIAGIALVVSHVARNAR